MLVLLKMGASSNVSIICVCRKLVKTAPGYKSELWVSLIEKAVSKIFGSYEDLERSIGSLKDDMYLLTGSPSYEYKLQSTTE